MSGSADHQAVLEEVRRTVLEEVDAKLGDKMKDLWSRGNKMLKQIEQENQQQTAKLLEEFAQRREKQEALKAEQEHLRTLLTSMVQQFSVLGANLGAPPAVLPPGLAGDIGVPAGPPGLTPSTPSVPACDASATSSTTAATPSLQESSPQMVTPAYIGGAFPPLPSMPDFPFPATTPDTASMPLAATPLSLVDALGSESPASIPASLLGSMPPTPSAEGELPEGDTGKIFSFTLRKADGTDLGINVSHHEHDKMLRVEGVRPEGAVEAWNRQCMGSAASEKIVMPGDRILSVNSVVNEPARMLEECRDKQLLKFTIMRGGAPMLHSPFTPTPGLAAAVPKATTLRADASEFVPGGLVTEQSQDAALSTENKSQDSEAAS
jgi:hypothetical protein